ncbi:flagellar assembly peptidoglycan hydrolase FlgJ [Gilvimarinus sp. DA14]|uniref:flagellar assembly peptidoglycan hydrolase FlgJ n=1 Tax=Gilvimarinus sp. DA14 TaxID=2956798 RepID=UPI0020B78783|nr:flagellar assembly peptidoglycan hydrolase FlgJ [Gilvimarinus sp. DA14]UTF60810.1 flagellar assembly peptidoglycan hydrolase FlgJ [Gilvimarinus sp. DA14]
MKSISSGLIEQNAQDTFFNSAGLDAVRKMGRNDDPQALKAVAQQFEAMFVQQMFKSMRAASEAFSEDNFLNSSESQFYQQMLDQQLSLELTQGRGMGLADALYQQLQQSYGEQKSTVSEVASSNINRTDEVLPQVAASRAAGKQGAEHPDNFVQSIKPYANWAAEVLGVDAKALMAQAALETGWGKHVLRDPQGNSSFNLFNIKASGGWQGDVVSHNTTEYENNTPYTEKAEFRRYNSLFESFSDFVDLMRKPRYREALAAGKDGAMFAEQLQRAGYATDPDYAEKIQAIMQRLDTATSTGEG